MTERMAWRRAVTRSRLPSSVRLTLLAHSEKGPSHWHDEDANEHAYPRALLAERVGAIPGTIRRHFRTAETHGFLVMHERGVSGQPSGQGRGHQTVFHYVTPTDPWPCESCARATTDGPHKGAQKGVQKGRSAYPLSAPLSEDRAAPPSSNPGQDEADRFLEFWQAYPRKIARGQARKAWTEVTEHTPAAVILAGLERQRSDLADKGGYCPYPATWLRDERWTDEPDESPRVASGYYVPDSASTGPLPPPVTEPRSWTTRR